MSDQGVKSRKRQRKEDLSLDPVDLDDERLSLVNEIVSRFKLASALTPSANVKGEFYEEKCALKTADTIVLFCRKLSLSFATLLTALVYLQLYKNSSKRWRSTRCFLIAYKDNKRKKFLKRDEQFLTAAACVLLAWKYKEDEVGVVKTSKKLLDISLTLYKIIASQNPLKFNNLHMSTSAWMLQDNGDEVRRLKAHIMEHETQLLHALDYCIGPITMPHTFIHTYLKLFLISMSPEFVEQQIYAKKMEDITGMLILDCYKTQMCIDYTPNEIVAIAIIKAFALLSFHNDDFALLQRSNDLYAHIKDVEVRLRAFINSLGSDDINPERIANGLSDLQKSTKLFEQSKLFKD